MTHRHIHTSTDGGATWSAQPNAGRRNWKGLACSSDGDFVMAAAQLGYVYLSFDAGEAWVVQKKLGEKDWRSVACSADGSCRYAVAFKDFIWTKAPGDPWEMISSLGKQGWVSVACCHEGRRAIAAAYAGSLYLTKNFGKSWEPVKILGSSNWQQVSMSPDGSFIVAIEENGDVFRSLDEGKTWDAVDTNLYWRSVTCSTNGGRRIACVDRGSIYIFSQEEGIWHVAQGLNDGLVRLCVASSTNGNVIVTASNGGYVSTSNDGGETWVEQESSGKQLWQAAACSANGMVVHIV